MRDSYFYTVCLLVAAAFFCAAVWWLPAARCNEVHELTGKQTEWRLISGCYVKVDGRWIPMDAWRGEQEVRP